MSSPRDVLLNVLTEAASQDPARMQNAVTQLQQWEATTQFNATLQDIFYDKSLDTNIRWQAIIYLKNGIDKYWRKNARSAIAPEEKVAIRSRLLTALDEEQKPLATQNAVLIAKIARLDFPLEWPDLLTTLLEIVRNSTANESDPRARLVQQRSLYTLHLVVKGLISKTLAAGRKQFQQVAPDLFTDIVAIYVRYVDVLFASNTTNIE
ncbi:Importin-11, partial [Haplosporangium bisporale]